MEAIAQYIAVPAISQIEVRTGAPLIAGSNLILVSMKGKVIPIMLPIKTILNIDIATIEAISIPPLITPKIYPPNAILNPKIEATTVSFESI